MYFGQHLSLQTSHVQYEPTYFINLFASLKVWRSRGICFQPSSCCCCNPWYGPICSFDKDESSNYNISPFLVTPHVIQSNVLSPPPVEMNGCLTEVPKALFLFHSWYLVSLCPCVFLSGFWCIHLHLLCSGDGYKDGRPGNLWKTLLPRGHVEPTGFLYRHGRVRTYCSIYAFCMSGKILVMYRKYWFAVICFLHVETKAST